jgi:hypothetical protein
MCHFFERGRCLKGERCNHAHGSEDLRMPVRRAGAGSSQGTTNVGGVIGDPTVGSACAPIGMWGMNPPVGNSMTGMGHTVAAPMGLRSPLSPLPLAELLGEGSNTNIASPEPPLTLGGIEASHLQSPDLFSMWSQWTPPAAFAGPLGLPVPPQAPAPPPNALVGATPTPIASFQALSPLHGAATAPPAALGPLCSPAPGPSDPAVSGEGTGRGLTSSKAPGGDLSNSVVCDLSNRLASLDIVCKGLEADVRNLSGGQGVAGSPMGEPPTPSTPMTPADARSERLVHRI